MTIAISDTSPTEILSRFQGTVTSSRPAYPEVLHLHVTDADGGEWCFATFEADYVPTDPAAFLGKTVVGTDLRAASAGLTINFSDGSDLKVVPFSLRPDEIDDDYESWKLFTPEGLVLKYGPGSHWLLKRASDPV
ncbi:MAG: hypothetical protein QM729_15225 [Solirubrobacterales bacterium]